MNAFRPLRAIRTVLLAGLVSVPVVLPFGCGEQAEGDRCDRDSGNADCEGGLTCVEAASLVDITVGDRCCPDPAESTGICTRRGGATGGTGGTAGMGGSAGAGQAGAAGAGQGGMPGSGGEAGAGGSAGAGTGGAGTGGAGTGGAGASGAGAGGAGAGGAGAGG